MPRVWTITPKTHEVALLLSQGMTQARAASESQLPVRTIENWLERPEFQELIEQYRAHVVDKQAAQLDEGMRSMVALWQQMVDGQVKANDGRIRWIRPIVERFFLSSFAFADDPEAKGSRAAVQVNVNTERRES